MQLKHFPRTELAQSLAAELVGQKPFGSLAPNPDSGTLLAATRRVGKTTFLQKDLLPVLEEAGLLPIYIDLWRDRNKPLAEHLQEAISQLLNQTQTRSDKISGWLKGIRKVAIPGIFSIDWQGSAQVSNVGTGLLELVQKRNQASKTPAPAIVLIIDEAQQAMQSEHGRNDMFALKALRDQFNINGTTKLLIILTGSDRGKLTQLAITNKSPFLGAQVRDFPLLKDEYAFSVAEQFNRAVAANLAISDEQAAKAFADLGRRPEFFLAALQAYLDAAIARDKDASIQPIEVWVQRELAKEHDSYSATLESLTPLQAVIFARILDGNQKLYDQEAQSELRADLLHRKSKDKVNSSSIQYALDELIKRGLIWQPARGKFEPEDGSWYRWKQTTRSALK